MIQLFRRGLVILLLIAVGCCIRDLWTPRARPPRKVRPEVVELRVTGYCRCGSCCGWRRNWFGRPVIAAGPNRGKPKAVGITASGTRAHPGTLAADTSIYPFGTIMYVPGYGYGRVEDRGGDIKGQHIDLYYRSHATALRWGNQILRVKVWKPGSGGADAGRRR